LNQGSGAIRTFQSRTNVYHQSEGARFPDGIRLECCEVAEIVYTLSIRQPWAALIVAGRKSIEIRSWPTRRRGRVLIHAAKIAVTGPAIWTHVTADMQPLSRHRGGVIGSVIIVECRGYPTLASFEEDADAHLNPLDSYEAPRYGFVLSDPIELPFFAVKGNTGFFQVEIA